MTPLLFFFAACAVFAGSAVYGSIGFGFAFVVIPVISVLDPTLLPPLVWLLGMPFALALLRRERKHADLASAGHILTGKLVGTPVGAWLLTLVPSGSLAVLFAGVLLLAASLTVIDRRTTRASRLTLVSVGLISGVMGTAAALGGPPLALGLRGMTPPAFRATLAACFVLGDLMSLVGLLVLGLVEWRHLYWALGLVPAMGCGYLMSSRIIRSVDARRLRIAVLMFAIASSVLVLVAAIL